MVPANGEKLRIVGVTLKVPALVAVPPGVVTAIVPVSAPLEFGREIKSV
jgi:hypothetical protein